MYFNVNKFYDVIVPLYFINCNIIFQIYINGKLIEEPMSSSLDIYHVTQYSGMPCQINPCMNGGVCVPKLDRVDCKCPKRFIGQLCEKSISLFFIQCSTLSVSLI